MQAFVPFFIILLVAVVFSQLFLRMRVPWVVSLILGGIAIGPNGFGWFEPDQTIEFLSTVGLVFLMFMAGLESKLSDLSGIKKNIAITVPLIGLFPAFIGVLVGLYFDYDIATSILLGIIFMSSAIALLVPTFQEHKIIDSYLGRSIIASAIIVDALSLLALSVFLQLAVGGGPSLESLLVYPFAIGSLALFAKFLPRLRWIAVSGVTDPNQDLFERELRFTVLILIGLVVFFEFVGLHAIVAGFFAGMILSKSMTNTLLKAKLHALSYGFFVPIFFVVVGATTDMSVFVGDLRATILSTVIIGSLVASKFISGWLAGRLNGFDNHSSAFIGVSVIPQLSTALAVAFLGFGEGVMDQALLSAVVALTIVTSFISPIFVNILGRKIVTKKPDAVVATK